MNFDTATASYIASLTGSRRRALKPSTVRRYADHAARLRLYFGSTELSKVRNGKVKEYIASLEGLTPATINGIFFVLRSIVSSVRNTDGDRIYLQQFDADFINLPVIQPSQQKTPTTTKEQIEHAPLLVKFLAASGLRVSEALSLSSDPADHVNYYDRETGTIHLRCNLKNVSARRVVILPAEFREFLNTRIPTIGPLFSQTYLQFHRELTRLRLPSAHSARRFRVTHLRKSGMNETIIRNQIGHSDGSMTSRYDRCGLDMQFARIEVEKCGIGFSLAS